MKSTIIVTLLNQNQPENTWTRDETLNDGYQILEVSILNNTNFVSTNTAVVVYPTIASEVVIISTLVNLLQAKLYSISGSLIKLKFLNGQEIMFKLDGLDSGNYFLAVKSEQETSTHKSIKK